MTAAAPLKGPKVHMPRSLPAALEVLARREPHCRIVAGGTDIMVMLHAGVVPAESLLDLWKVDELRGQAITEGAVLFGALTTYTELMTSSLVSAHLPILAEAAATVGAVQIQNRGTLGGNLANASPAADLVPVLSALDAELELVSQARGARWVSIHAFFVGYRKTCLEPDELLGRVKIPLPCPGTHLLFRKVGTRRAQAISKVVLAGALERQGPRLGRARLAAGSVAPTVVRLRESEQVLDGARLPLGEPERQALLSALGRDISPIDDIRSTAHYRRQVTGKILLRALEGVLDG